MSAIDLGDGAAQDEIAEPPVFAVGTAKEDRRGRRGRADDRVVLAAAIDPQMIDRGQIDRHADVVDTGRQKQLAAAERVQLIDRGLDRGAIADRAEILDADLLAQLVAHGAFDHSRAQRLITDLIGGKRGSGPALLRGERHASCGASTVPPINSLRRSLSMLISRKTSGDLAIAMTHRPRRRLSTK
ncbi:hypothetical protein [Lysobacter capsici]|uniref:hypothetical protein n=1 Tax=Lysobacter capsici TaxID=435897 RepID=UPI0011DFEAEA|nr:hypothetical protein [Lysobacter capsici]